MKRILVFVNHFKVSGVTSVVQNIYRGVDKTKFCMDFVRKNVDINSFDEEVVADGNQVFYYNDCPLNKIPILNYKMQQIKIAKQILRQIRGIRYDAIHIHANPIIGLYVGKKANIPVRIMHTHEAIPDFGDNINKSWVTRAIWRHRQKKYNQWATVKAGDSLKACKVKFGENVVDDPKVCVLYPPVDMIKFNPATYGEETEVEKSINTSAFNMIHVGRLNPVKNQAFLIDILSEMNKIRESDLYIIGNGEQKDALLSYARLKGVESKFHLLPPDASPAIYRKMNCSLLPSFSEAFGMVAVESQLMGVPCFASTNVPNDVDIGMCQFIDLSKGAEEWAKQIYLFDYINACVSPNKKNAFTVQNLLEKLEEKYSE
ncbi:MAG: glycosyltransferase [Clostridia bacterium]|nr:glycosyltransferase [Clostridia bacterium]